MLYYYKCDHSLYIRRISKPKTAQQPLYTVFITTDFLYILFVTMIILLLWEYRWVYVPYKEAAADDMSLLKRLRCTIIHIIYYYYIHIPIRIGRTIRPCCALCVLLALSYRRSYRIIAHCAHRRDTDDLLLLPPLLLNTHKYILYYYI